MHEVVCREELTDREVGDIIVTLVAITYVDGIC